MIAQFGMSVIIIHRHREATSREAARYLEPARRPWKPKPKLVTLGHTPIQPGQAGRRHWASVAFRASICVELNLCRPDKLTATTPSDALRLESSRLYLGQGF